MKAVRNAEYLAKIDRSFAQLETGRGDAYMEYRYFYLCFGIIYKNMKADSNPYSIHEPLPMENWQKELCEQLDDFYKNGWELVQLDNDLMNGKCADGYGLFRRRKQ